MAGEQVYYRIRRADGKYWSILGWLDVIDAAAYRTRPRDEYASAGLLDPTARVVKVTVRRKPSPGPRCACGHPESEHGWFRCNDCECVKFMTKRARTRGRQR